MSFSLHPLSNLARDLGLAVLASSILATSLAAQVPSTDIGYVRLSPDGELVEGSFVRVTDRDLYDNQPSFLNDNTLLFTSMKRGAGTDSTTEIVRYDLATKTSGTLIDTSESEYSPTKIPGRAAISMVRDYGEQKQQLWSVELADSGESKAEKNLLPGINPIGYHAWVDERRVLLFVLGEPPTLQVATLGPQAGRVLAKNPGRALARIPDSRLMSFVHKVSEEEWWLCSVDVDATADGPQIERLLQMPQGSEDYTWSPDGSVWTAQGSELLRAPPADPLQWHSVANLRELGVQGLSRMAFDASGRTLALVFSR